MLSLTINHYYSCSWCSYSYSLLSLSWIFFSNFGTKPKMVINNSHFTSFLISTFNYLVVNRPGLIDDLRTHGFLGSEQESSCQSLVHLCVQVGLTKLPIRSPAVRFGARKHVPVQGLKVIGHARGMIKIFIPIDGAYVLVASWSCTE
jgi:hypothetical protein